MWRSNSQKKESLSKELEHERMLRVDAENRLHDVTQESDNCRSRLHALQEEFKKMEDMVQNMLQYKSKIDQLKQEKSSLSITYENNLQKFGNHISDLERENMVLLNEVKKLESQMNNKTADGRDKSKLLLERLRMLEKENSSLVLENEQQRQQYEKCLDEIANQVVQALLAQKMLREECMKLQNRVHDLELQNRQLSILFHQRMKLTSESVQQHALKADQAGEADVYVQGSMESLQSIFSEQMSENLAIMPQMSTPPPWLQERLSLTSDHFYGDRLSIISLPGSIQSTPDLNNSIPEPAELCCRSVIETEFPATPSSPKVKHINVIERKKETKRSSSTSSLAISSRPSKVRTRSTSSLSRARGLSLSPQGIAQSERNSRSLEMTLDNQGNLDTIHSGQSDGNVQITSQVGNQEKVSAENLLAAANQVQQGTLPSPSQKAAAKTPAVSNSLPISKSSPTRKRASGSNDKSQVSVTRQTSKLPVFSSQTSQSKESTQTRRNSKTETGIRMGCKSPVSKTLSSANGKQPQPQPQPQPHSPPVTSAQSVSSGSVSRIPSMSKSSNRSQKPVKTAVKEKGGLTTQNSHNSDKVLPPGSPQVRHSGIKTTLKVESKLSPPAVIDTPSANPSSFISSVTLTPTIIASVMNTNSKSAVVSNSSASKGKEVKSIGKGHTISSMPQWRHEGPYANPRPETHFPRMGTTNLTHSSQKTELPSPQIETVNTAITRIAQVPKASTPKPEMPNIKPDSFLYADQVSLNSALGNLNKGQYFYDYSDEDSDWNRPVSKDFSIASSLSLDEMLDKTLENVETPADMDFTSDTSSLFKGPVVDNGANTENNNVPNTVNDENSNSSKNVEEINDNDIRLRGKPDIVKDTEECEQRNLKKSLTASQIPGSGMTGYRARRPKSLILGSKDKKFVYAEYGSSSSLDSSSDESWSYQISYAKNIKQQEIQSKVANSLKVGEAKEVETPTNLSTLEVTLNAQNDKNSKISKPTSQIPRPNLSKKTYKTPPPIAQKPSKRKSPTNSVGERPKSVEICVNTVLAPSVTNPVTSCFPYHNSIGIFHETDFGKFPQEKFSTLPQAKAENGDKKLDTSDSFDEVTVERSGSRDDGYSTMSSDVQPEAIEKFSDDNVKERHYTYDYSFDYSTISKQDNDLRHRFDTSSDHDSALDNSAPCSDIKKSSQGLQSPVSNGDRYSQCGSLGRVKAMKLKYEIEIQNRSPEREMNIAKSPPVTPQKSPKTKFFSDKFDHSSLSKIPLVQPSSASISSQPQVPQVQSKIPLSKNVATQNQAKPDGILPPSRRPEDSLKFSKVSPISQTSYRKPEDALNISQNITEQFDKLSYFMPPSEQVSFLNEGGNDSGSSASERGSDLTSLHISEDNILSDIPEEKDGYESSVGKLSETNSLTSFSIKEHHTVHEHTCCQNHKVHFEVRLKKYWLSLNGLMRGISESDINKASHVYETSISDDMYDGNLNMEMPLERSASESDVNKHGDKPEKRWLPRLSCSRQRLFVDEIAVEGRVNDILKQMVFQQLSKTAESADSDDKTFSNYVEMLIQKGYVMPNSSSYQNMETSLQSRMSVSCSSGISSKEQYPNEHFESEERLSRESSCGPVGEEQKLFNSQFYSLCNVGSNHSISENSENKTDDISKMSNMGTATKVEKHDCDQLGKECKKCLEEKNAKEFDEISKQIESLSKTVNELHKSLTSLNSENNDSGSESNEGDHSSLFNSAIGNKEIDGYQWLEDEFFLSPYGGEVILGTSPFSDTGASCDWMNEYIDDRSHLDETYAEREALHEAHSDMSSTDLDKNIISKSPKSRDSSILAGMIDSEGNFNSQEFISQRLKQQELKLGKAVGANSVPSGDISNIRRPGDIPLLKEELHTTPEKDYDTSLAEIPQLPGTQLLQTNLAGDGLSLSQDSLDDNIGVDQVMCHRLLGEGKKKAIGGQPGCRPALDFTSKLFTRYGDLEKEAVAAFDFLNHESASLTSLDKQEHSNQKVERTISHDPFVDSSVLGRSLTTQTQQYYAEGTEKGDGRLRSHDQIPNTRLQRAAMYGAGMDQSVSSTDSYLSPVKKSRRKLRAKIKRGERVNSRRALRRATKFSSTSADESFDELSFSDSCCYHSYSSSTDSLEDKV